MRPHTIFADESLPPARYRHCSAKYCCLILFIFILKGLLNPMPTHGNPPNGENGVAGSISSAQARTKARQGLFATPWIDEINLPFPQKTLRAGEPLLVQRVDRHDSFYYLVPFKAKKKTWVVVIVDAATGRFKESAKIRPAGIYPKISSTQAEKILGKRLQRNLSKSPLSLPPPMLVWRPCLQTQSPYEPLWRFRLEADVWFIDQTGKVYQQIEELPLKGAGPRP
jgi:hypothetical protein